MVFSLGDWIIMGMGLCCYFFGLLIGHLFSFKKKRFGLCPECQYKDDLERFSSWFKYKKNGHLFPNEDSEGKSQKK